MVGAVVSGVPMRLMVELGSAQPCYSTRIPRTRSSSTQHACKFSSPAPEARLRVGLQLRKELFGDPLWPVCGLLFQRKGAAGKGQGQSEMLEGGLWEFLPYEH